MLIKTLPEYITLEQSVNQELELKGEVKLASLTRLVGLTQSAEGTAYAEMRFGKDKGGVTVVKGAVKADLTLECQRCLGPCYYPVQSVFNLGAVENLQAADNLPACYEPLLIHEGNIALWELLEDELILNLPIIAKHDPEKCAVKITTHKEADKEKNQPFKVLAELKKGKQ